MNKQTMGAAAALVALAGLASQAKSDNTPKPASPVQGAPAASAPAKPTKPAANPDDSGWESIADAFDGFKADTKPCRDTTMQFPAATEIKEIKAVGGQRVKKGETLIRARDSDILANIAQQKDLAENDNEIKGAEKQAELAQFKFDRLRNGGTYSPTEFREAEINAEVARVNAEQARRNKIQNELKYKQAQASYERYYLEAPFDGIVEEVLVDLGEGVTEQTKVIHVVNIDKLWLDPYASTPQTIRLGLKENSPAWVLVDMPDAPRYIKGRVLYVSPVADSVSQTRRVRVEIDNPEGWPAGTQARVRFTDPGTEWEKYQHKSGLSSAAPEGPKSVAVGVSPRNETAGAEEPWKGVTCGITQGPAHAMSTDGLLGGFTFDIQIGSEGAAQLSGDHVCGPTWSRTSMPVALINLADARGADPWESWRLKDRAPLLDSWPSKQIKLPVSDPVRDEQLRSGAAIIGPPGTKIGEPSK
jgi:RND family efflux transporter MFP subunit